MEAIKKIIKDTNGKKTTTVAILYLLFEAFKIWKPNVLSENVEHLVMLSINTGLVSSLGHKLVRNRKQIGKYIKSKYKLRKQHLK